MSKNLSWWEAEALEIQGLTGIRREPWTGRWMIYVGSLWRFVVKDDKGAWTEQVDKGTGPDATEVPFRFTVAELTAGDWTNEPEEGGTLPPRDIGVLPPVATPDAPGNIITGTFYPVSPLLSGMSSDSPPFDRYYTGGPNYGAGFFIRWNVPTGTDVSGEIVGRLLHESLLPFIEDDLDASISPTRGYPLYGESVGVNGLHGRFYRGTAGSQITPEWPSGTGFFSTAPGESWWVRLGLKIGSEIAATVDLEAVFPHVPPGISITAHWSDAPDGSHSEAIDPGPDGIYGTEDDIIGEAPCWIGAPPEINGIHVEVTVGGETGGTHLLEVSIGGTVLDSDTVGAGTAIFNLTGTPYADCTVTATYLDLSAGANLVKVEACP